MIIRKKIYKRGQTKDDKSDFSELKLSFCGKFFQKLGLFGMNVWNETIV